MTGKLTNFYINVQTLGKEIDVQLVMTMIFEEINFIVGHSHFTIIVFQASFIYDKTAIGHHVFAEVGFFTFISTGNAEVRPNLATFFHVLFGKKS